jgi:G3E family GTPase
MMRRLIRKGRSIRSYGISSANQNPLKVTVLTGFLGSGKTTLLNRILRENHGKKIAVIENELGDIAIDASLVEDMTSDKNSIVLMKNGCLCCTIRDDLVDALQDILNRHLESPLDGVIIEATGVALPSPIAETFFTSAYVRDFFEIQSFVAMVDSANFNIQLKHSEDTMTKQIAFADMLVLNKIDAVQSETRENVSKQLRSINSAASLVECSHADIDVSTLLNESRGSSFDLETVEIEMSQSPTQHNHHHHHHHHHHTSTSSVSLSFEGDLDSSKLESFFASLLEKYGATTLYRSKGIFSLKNEPKRFVMQTVQELYSGDILGEWGNNEKRINRVVFIGQDLDRDQLQSDLLECVALH